jgi:hypothetical protein
MFFYILRRLILFVPVIFLFGLSTSWAVNTAETNAQAVYLRQDCGTQTPNCFNNMEDLLNWTWNTRNPNAANPLLIDVGPGNFPDFYCSGDFQDPNKGWVTVRGSGRENTKIVSGGRLANGGYAVSLTGCTQLAFQDLSIAGGAASGIYWTGAGLSSYSNIKVTGKGFAWYGGFPGKGVHYWFNSVLTVNDPNCGTRCAAFFDYMHENWFFGGEIAYVGYTDITSGAAAVYLSNAATGSSELQLFGTLVRAKAASSAVLTTLTAVRADSGQTFHSHGGVISVNASAAGSANVNVFAIDNGIVADENGVDPDGAHAVIHTPDTAFAMKAKGTGTVTRLKGAHPNISSVESPFLWPSSTNPPALTGSRKGADIFVETDCNSNGDCDSGIGTEPHVMVFSKSCTTSGPWFNSTKGRCRGVLQ